ncbi:hypothetical protein FB567DRAFT_94399 [Paraphoma chrysanthemicola]|uniref:Uncharacterized protein n=1 Tax=Paraphoma chrysanthemicola TaxID=798071 RepID=A0A8K0VWU7_9PLEO|nr:hypothetical protein FB567DRAFT_94399 [Paraphoma chrysanthemicola]
MAQHKAVSITFLHALYVKSRAPVTRRGRSLCLLWRLQHLGSLLLLLFVPCSRGHEVGKEPANASTNTNSWAPFTLKSRKFSCVSAL